MEGIHKGVDVQAVRGTPALSPVRGKITRTWNEPEGLGKQIGVRGPDGNEVRFAHLDRTLAKPGQRVGAGEQIATVGSTGAGSTGAHLDIRALSPRGQYLDPTPMLGSMAQMPRADKPIGAGQEPPQGPQAQQLYGLSDEIVNQLRRYGVETPSTVTAQDIRLLRMQLEADPRWRPDSALARVFNVPDPNIPLRPGASVYPLANEAFLPHWEGNFNRPPPATEPLTLYRGVYPASQGYNQMGTQAPSGQAPGGGPLGSTWGNSGQWFTDNPQWGLMYGSSEGSPNWRQNQQEGWPSVTADMERLRIPGSQGVVEPPQGIFNPPPPPGEVRPGGLYSITLSPEEQAQLWVRQAPDWAPGAQGAPREYLLPPEIAARMTPRFMGNVAGNMLPMIESVLPEELRNNINTAPNRALNWGREQLENQPWFPTNQSWWPMGPNNPETPPGGNPYWPRGIDAPSQEPSPEESWVGGGQDMQVGVGQTGDGWGTGWLPQGGLYGQQKWSGPGNDIDLFVSKGSPIYAPADGIVQQLGQAIQGPMGSIPGLIFSDSSGRSVRMVHVQPSVAPGQHVSRGQVIAYVADPSMDMLSPAPIQALGGQDYNHIDLAFGSSPNAFRYGSPSEGGDVSAVGWLQQNGYQGNMVARTPGPPEGMAGGGGMMGGLGGMPGGFPGMPGGLGGMPGMPGGFGGTPFGDPMSMMMGGGMGGMMGGGMPGGGSPFGGGFGGSPMMGGAPSFGQPSLGASMAPQMQQQAPQQVSNTTPAGVTGVPMPEIKPLDMSIMPKLDRPDDPTPWLTAGGAGAREPYKPVEHQEPNWDLLAAAPVVGPLGTRPFQPQFWTQPRSSFGQGQDVGVGGMTSSANVAQGKVFGLPRPRRTFRRRNDVGVGQNSLMAGATQGTGGQTQVTIAPYEAAQLQQQQQNLQLSQQQISGQLQQINDNYQLRLKELEQQYKLTGDSNALEQDRLRLQDSWQRQSQELQMRLANIQTQQNALDRNLRQQEINNTFQVQMQQLQQQWMGHQDDALFQRQQLGLQDQWQQQSNALALVHDNKQAQLQLQLAQGTLGFNQEQLGVNANLSLAQLAAQTGLSQEQLKAQMGMGLTQLGQQAADQAANRQLDLYKSALSNPWLQDLTGLAPEYNAPGGPGETGWASAHGMQARADMSTILPNGKIPEWYAQIGSTQVNQHPDWLNQIGRTKLDQNPSWLRQTDQDYQNMVSGMTPVDLGTNGFQGNYQNTWNGSMAPPSSGTGNQDPFDPFNGMVWTPFTPTPLGTQTPAPTNTTGAPAPQATAGTLPWPTSPRPSPGAFVVYTAPNGRQFTNYDLQQPAPQGTVLDPNGRGSPQSIIAAMQRAGYSDYTGGQEGLSGVTADWWQQNTPINYGDASQSATATPTSGASDQQYVGTGQDAAPQARYLGQLPKEILSAYRTNPEVGLALIEHWVKTQEEPPTQRYVGSGSDVPYLMPFENPQYRGVGVGADYDPFADPMAQGGGVGYSKGAQGPSGIKTTQPTTGTIQSGFDQAFGGPRLQQGYYGGGGSGDNGYLGPPSQAPTPPANEPLPQTAPPNPYEGMDYVGWQQNFGQHAPQTEDMNWMYAPGNRDTWFHDWQANLGKATPGSPYDLNQDNLVDMRDWGEWQARSAAYQAPDNTTYRPGWNPYDVNQDNVVDMRDWGLIQKYQNEHPAPPPPAPPPTVTNNPPPPETTVGGVDQFELPVPPGQIGFNPAPIFQPPPPPEMPDWRTMQYMTPFERSAFMTKVMMSGVPWAQYQDAMRHKWAEAGGPTVNPTIDPLTAARAHWDPMTQRNFSQLADVFGEGPDAYWKRMQNFYAPSQNAGAMVRT